MFSLFAGIFLSSWHTLSLEQPICPHSPHSTLLFVSCWWICCHSCHGTTHHRITTWRNILQTPDTCRTPDLARGMSTPKLKEPFLLVVVSPQPIYGELGFLFLLSRDSHARTTHSHACLQATRCKHPTSDANNMNSPPTTQIGRRSSARTSINSCVLSISHRAEEMTMYIP